MKASDKAVGYKIKPVPILGAIICAMVTSAVLTAVLTQFILTGKIAYDSIAIYIYGILAVSVVAGVFVSLRKQKNVVSCALITLGFWGSLISINTLLYREPKSILPCTLALLIGFVISILIGKKGRHTYNKKHRYR